MAAVFLCSGRGRSSPAGTVVVTPEFMRGRFDRRGLLMERFGGRRAQSLCAGLLSAPGFQVTKSLLGSAEVGNGIWPGPRPGFRPGFRPRHAFRLRLRVRVRLRGDAHQHGGPEAVIRIAPVFPRGLRAVQRGPERPSAVYGP